MAARYWVGGTDTWNSTAGTKWSTTSGGAGGAAVPTSADTVYFDANSGSGTVTTTSSSVFSSIDTTDESPFTGTLSLGADFGTSSSFIYLYGDAAAFVGNGYSVTCIVIVIQWASFTCHNITAIYNAVFYGGTITISGNVSASAVFISANGPTLFLNMGNGTWTVTGTGNVWRTNAGASIFGDGSTIVISNSSATAKTMSGSYTYYSATFSGDNITITGSNTFEGTFAVNNAGMTNGLKFTSGTTQTLTASSNPFTTNGSAGSLAKILSTTAGSPFTLSAPNTPAVSVDYMSIKDSTVTQSNVWYAGTHSTDVSGNTRWLFTGIVYNLIFSDAISSASTQTASRAASASVADPISNSDALSTSRAAPDTLTDAIALDDTMVSGFVIYFLLSDTVEAADELQGAHASNVTMSDAASTADSFTPARDAAMSISDTASTSDVLSVVKGVAEAISESLSASDAVSPSIAMNVVFSNPVSATDALSLARAAALTVANSVSVSDTAVVTQGSSATTSSEAITGDSTSGVSDVTTLISSLVSLTDSLVGSRTGITTISDAAGTSSTFTGSSIAVDMLTDQVQALDEAVARIIISMVFADYVSPSDALNSSYAMRGAISDSLAAYDVVVSITTTPDVLLNGYVCEISFLKGSIPC